MPRRIIPRAKCRYDLAADEGRRAAIREEWAASAVDGCGNMSATARALGISRKHLYAELDRLGMRDLGREAKT